MQQALRYNLNPRRGVSDKTNVLRRHVAEHTECADGTYCVL